MIGSQRGRMTDEAMEAYVEWREECARVWDAYDRWLGAVRADAALAFPAYLAALDREERASEVYAGLVSRLDHLPGRGAGGEQAGEAPPRERVRNETVDDE
jgi:predicted ABC-type transport system involved in lysophospholipase L1 biosynthesis ATPase subunit